MTVDQKVYDLAASFLEGKTDEDKRELAELIQMTIEDYLSVYHRPIFSMQDARKIWAQKS